LFWEEGVMNGHEYYPEKVAPTHTGSAAYEERLFRLPTRNSRKEEFGLSIGGYFEKRRRQHWLGVFWDSCNEQKLKGSTLLKGGRNGHPN
jgi:hypothetical protein